MTAHSFGEGIVAEEGNSHSQNLPAVGVVVDMCLEELECHGMEPRFDLVVLESYIAAAF